MKQGRFLCFSLAALLVVCAAGDNTLAGEVRWRRADAPRAWTFPRDHGSHPAYKTEWWYFTGNLADEKGNRYGYQLTFFRRGVRAAQADPGNPWSLRDIYLAHFTITDVSGKRFLVDERVSRTGPNLSGARTDGLDVRVLDWSAKRQGNSFVLNARNENASLKLIASPAKAPVLHGEKGLSMKGPARGQASHYMSYTALQTEGQLELPGPAGPVKVKGTSWFDHEFGSNQLSPEQTGWDWFGLHLSDGKDLMLYMIRRSDGSVEKASSGTLCDAQGNSRRIPLAAMSVEVLDCWKSGKSGANYPSRWRIRIPAEGIDIFIAPLLPDQELITGGSTGVTYWEGAVEGRGVSSNRNVACRGYAELTGYAGRIGGLF